MKKTIKRGVAILLAAIMAIGASGCQKAKEDEIVELTYLAYNNPQPDEEKVIAKVNEYLEEKIGVRVKWNTIAEYNTKTQMLFATGEEFDVCFTAHWTNFADNVDNGVFMPLDDLLKKEGKEIYEMTPEYLFDAAKIDGEIYALPVIKDVAEQWSVRCKKELVDKYGLDVSEITSLEELTPVFQTIKDNEPGFTVALMRGNSDWFKFLPFESVTGTKVGAFRLDDSGKVVNQYETEEAKEFFELMRDWYKKGFMRSDAANATSDSDIIASDKWFAQYVGYLPLADAVPQTTYEYIFGLNEPHLRTGNLMGAGFAISANSKHPEKAMEFINIMNTDKYLRNLVGLGIEGEHWVAVGDDQWKLPDGVEKKDETGYSPMDYPQGNRFLLRVKESETLDKWDKYEEFNNTAVKYPTIGFIFDTSSLTAEIAAINEVYNEFAPSLLVGAVEPDEYLPKFLEELKVAGSEKVIAEIQRQYDEWKKEK